jgi:TRAP-type transport system periplasmic protein
MRKKIFCAFLTLMIGLFLVAPFAAAKTIIKVAHVDRGDRNQSMMAAFADTFKDVVEYLSVGEMEVKIYPAAQLGSQRELLESTQLGAVHVVPSFTSVASIFSPKAELMAAPFLFPSEAHAWYVLDGPFGRELADGILQDSKLRVLAYGEANGFRQLWTSKKAVHKPADMKGMKIRVPESKMILKVMAAFSANPVVIPWTELYTSMQTGVADGWEGEACSLVDQKLYETVKYGTLINYSYNTCYIFANGQWFESLSPKEKQIVVTAARSGAVASRGVSQSYAGSAMAIMKSRGVQIFPPNAEEMGQFIKMGQAAGLESLEKTAGKEWVQKLIQASEEAKKALAIK